MRTSADEIEEEAIDASQRGARMPCASDTLIDGIQLVEHERSVVPGRLWRVELLEVRDSLAEVQLVPAEAERAARDAELLPVEDHRHAVDAPRDAEPHQRFERVVVVRFVV